MANTTTSAPAPDDQPTPPNPSADSLVPAVSGEAWNGTNLGGDIVEAGIRKQKPEFQEDLRWFWRYSGEIGLSQSAAAEQLGIDSGTYSKVMRGEYKGPNQLLLAPPMKMLSRIRVLRNQERETALRRSAGRVKTLTVMEIWQVCQKAWDDRLIAFIFGDSHIGKTEAIKWFRDENNHGATLYVDLQGVTGIQDIYREFAKALRISPDRPLAKLMPAVHSAIDRTNLVIVDEFHHITYAYQKGSSIRMVNALKSIKDRCGCGMVICATDVGREEFETGKESKLLSQLWRRGTIKLQLPSVLRVGDVRAFATAYGLDFPAPLKLTRDEPAETWKRLEIEHPAFIGFKVCDRIAHDYGVQHLVSVFRDGGALAKKAARETTWADVTAAQGVYDNLSAKKKA